MSPAADYALPLSHLEAFYDEPGERGWILEGYKHGLTTTSAILTETAPGGGPPAYTGYTMVYDDHNRQAVTFGGYYKCRLAADTGSPAVCVQGSRLLISEGHQPEEF